jgi:type I restriction enzyme, R subunit
VAKRVDGISDDRARSVAEAIVARAGELCFPNWYAQAYMDTELYREFTILLATTFKNLNLHGQGKDFVDRCVRLLKKVRFVREAEG